MRKKIEDAYLREIVISIIVVTQNDADSIEDILQKINNVLSLHYPNYEIIIIDNNSFDQTLGKMQNICKNISNIKIIKLARIYDIDLAYTAGLDNCIGDYAILFNFHVAKPQIIPHFIETLVIGYDIVALRPTTILFPRWSPQGFSLSIIEKISQNKFTYEPVYLLAFTRKVINNATKIRRKNRNFLYINNVMGFKKTILEYPLLSANKNVRAPNFLEFLFTVINIIIANSFKPLRLFTAIGVFFSFIFLLYCIILVVFAFLLNIYLIPKMVIGLTFIAGMMFFLLFSLLALLAEYIIRISEETKDEPLYFISDEIDKSIIIKNRKKTNII